MISLLTPSRGRVHQLRESVLSVLENAAIAPLVQFVIAVDPDDVATIAFCAKWKEDLVDNAGATADLFRFIIVDERYGYAQLYRYYNELAAIADGEWLMLWNDDARMVTPDWNLRTEELPPETLVADFQSDLSAQGFVAFPAMHRKMYEALGHYCAETPHVDSYIQDIGRSLGRVRTVPEVHVHHDRPDLTGSIPDQTFIEGRAGMRHEHYFSAEFQETIAQAIDKCRAAGI